MTGNGLKIGGAIVFWSLGEYFHRSLLQTGWEQCAFGKFVPEPRPHTAALKDALQAMVGGRRRLIRPLKNRDGFHVQDETLGADSNAYDHYLSARITSKPDAEKVTITFDPLRDQESELIVAQFNKYSGYLTSGQVAGGLVNLMGSLSATTMRPKGGLYWVPDFSLAHVRAAASVVEGSAAEGSKSAVYVMRNVMDADAIRAVRDAIIAEVTGEVARLDAEIMDQDNPLGERALTARKGQVAELRLKVKEYESILGEGLGQLVAATERTEQVICKAEIFAAAGTEAVA